MRVWKARRACILAELSASFVDGPVQTVWHVEQVEGFSRCLLCSYAILRFVDGADF